MKGKDIIKLEYVEKGVVYHGEIDKSNFVNQMEHMVKWYSDCNENASRLCALLPSIEYIRINQDIIDTQTNPFIEYHTIGDDTPKCLKFKHRYTIIWSFFVHQCEEAKQNSK